MKKLKILYLFFLISNIGYAQANFQLSTSSTPSCTNDGTATAQVVSGGVAPFLYEWTSTYPSFVTQFTQTAINLPGGFYYLKVTDAMGAIEYSYADVLPNFEIHVTTTPDTCLLGVGTAEVAIISPNIIPPVNYLWSNNATTSQINGLSSGVYFVTVTMGNGCFVNSINLDLDSIGLNWGNQGTVSTIASFQVSFTTTPANCINGTATPLISGGQAPFTYSWSTNPIQTTATATGLHSGTFYNLITTDATGCINTTFAFLNSNTNFTANFTQTYDTCGMGHGVMTPYGLGGLPPYTYLWGGGSTSQSQNNLVGGNGYDVTVTDANGCSVRISNFLNNFSPLSVTTSQVPSNCSSNTGSITAIVNGGLAPYLYSWQTQPAQTTATASNLGFGLYPLIVTDQNGCMASVVSNLIDNSNMLINVTKTDDLCNSLSGSATVVATNGQAPYSYSWNTNPAQTTATATGLGYGTYKVTVTDVNGCIRTKSISIGNNSPVNLNISTTNASCIYIADATGTAMATGGTAPYTFNWQGVGTGATQSNLLPGYYNVTVYDVNGCQDKRTVQIGYLSSFPCAVDLTGVVYADMNSDCNFNSSDFGVNGVWVSAGPTGGFQMTNSSGYFDFVMPSPGNYNLDLTVPVWYDWNCGPRPAMINIPALGASISKDLPMQGSALDMVLFATSFNRPVPGFLYDQQVNYKNQGSLSSGTGEVVVYYDSAVTFFNSIPMPTTHIISKHELHYFFSNIIPSQPFVPIQIFYQVPTNLAIGNILNFADTISNFLSNDTVKYNNYFLLHEAVVGPYDPNEIQVYPSGTGVQGYIGYSDSVLIYTVRFQNSGNYPAQNVIVKVQTDLDLDMSTFQFMSASDGCTISADDNGVLTFSFIGINLLDSLMNEAESHGYLTFSLKQKKGLSQGTQFNCSADIYFDFNAPVATNTTLNTLTGIQLPGQPSSGVNLYPNPASDIIYLQSSEGNYISEIELYDAMGRLIVQNNSISMQTNLFELNIQSLQLPSGIYFVSVETKYGLQMLKFIKK